MARYEECRSRKLKEKRRTCSYIQTTEYAGRMNGQPKAGTVGNELLINGAQAGESGENVLNERLCLGRVTWLQLRRS